MAVVFLLLFTVCVSAGTAAAAPSSSHTSLTKKQVLGLLNGGVASERVEALVKNRGISFAPTSTDIAALEKAGASSSLIDILKSEAPAPAEEAKARPVERRAPRSESASDSLARVTAPPQPRSSPAQAEQGLSRGNALFAQGNWGEAARVYRLALLRDPNNIVVRTNLALALSREGQEGEAIAQFKTILRTTPGLVEAHNGLGIAYRKQGNLKAAAREFQAAIRYQPKDARAHNNLAVTLQQEGRITDAISEYRSSLRLEPNCCNASFNLGTALALEGDNQDAVAAFRSVVKAQPRNARAHFALASALEGNREYPAALKQYRIAASLAPGDRTIHRSYSALLAHVNSAGQSEHPN